LRDKLPVNFIGKTRQTARELRDKLPVDKCDFPQRFVDNQAQAMAYEGL
jgi:hypothetical protein